MQTASTGNSKIIQNLLAGGVKVHTQPQIGQAALMAAAENGNIERVMTS